MLRIILGLFFLTSCSLGVIKTGGDDKFHYNSDKTYTIDELRELAPKVIETLKRDPMFGKVDDLFTKTNHPLRKVGIIVFETMIQPTRDGLASDNKVYLSEQGKQLFTERFYKIWAKSLPVIDPSLKLITASKFKKAKSFSQYGSEVEDFIKVKRLAVDPDDIFFLEKGKKTTMNTVLNPRGMRDMSLLLVPAYELMGGPKWSEQNKHFVNDVIKELDLDAVIIVMSEISWTAAHIDKQSGDFIPEEMMVNLRSSVLTSLSSYHERLEKLKIQDRPSTTLCFRSYESIVKRPVKISVEKDQENFQTVEAEVINPMMKIYADVSQMMMIQLTNDLKETK